jgi:LuxR family maltose regulon positive regulatory protein
MALLWLEEPQVTRARILVARGKQADIQAALQLLESLEEITNRTHNTRHKIEVLALRALALDTQGKSSEANAALKQSVDLAHPGGFIRVFVDLGRPMQEMLRRLMNQDLSGDVVRRILAHFPGENQNSTSENSVQPRSVSNLALADPLTTRELEVLKRLREPASVKEIANELHLSPATVKRHINNIYAKLGVNKRSKAVARAQELNILPSR